MLETSGLLLTEHKDGSLQIEYADYNTPLGGEFESIYFLNKENAIKLRKLMRKMHPLLNLKKALIREVGKNLSDQKLVDLLVKNEIKYDHSTWVSYDNHD